MTFHWGKPNFLTQVHVTKGATPINRRFDQKPGTIVGGKAGEDSSGTNQTVQPDLRNRIGKVKSIITSLQNGP
jgi:hypothetical protein